MASHFRERFGPSFTASEVQAIWGSVPTYSVVHEGADPTGVVDSSAAFASAVAKAKAAGGGVVNVGPGLFIALDVPVESGVQFHGAGSTHAPGATSATRIKLPAGAAAGSACFRLSTNVTDYLDGAGWFDMEIDGLQYIGASTMPASPTTTVEIDKIRGIDLRQSTKIVISSVNTGTEEITTATPHNFNTGDTVGFDVASGGVLANGLTINPGVAYINKVSANVFIAYNSYANAVAGGATGKTNIGGSPTGTTYCYRTIVGVYQTSFDRCYIHNFDECVRGSSTVDRSSMLYTNMRYSYVGFQGQEHPRFLNSRCQSCYFGITGRFVDMVMDESNQFAGCFYGLAPYDVTGAGGTSYLGNTGSTYIINNCTISGEYYQNVVAITVNANNTVTDNTFIVGTPTDSGTLLASKSIGVRVQGNNNTISGHYGQGTSATSFAIAAILLDRNANGNDSADTLIDGANFNLASAVAGNAAIAGGDTNLSTPAFGGGNWGGGVGRVTIRNCQARLGNLRFIYLHSTSGSVQYSNIVGNVVSLVSGGSNTMGAAAGVIEGSFYTGCEISHNRIYNINGTCGNAFKQSSNLATTTCRFITNRFDGTFSVSPMSFNGGPTTCTFRGNGGNAPFITEAAGNSTISAATSVAVTHGMALTPTIVNITPTGTTGTVGAPYVTAIGATTFTVNVPVSGTMTFNWEAKYNA